MRANRVVLSICALVAIVIAAPFAAYAHAVDHLTDVAAGAACNENPDVPAMAGTDDVTTLSPIRRDLIVALDEREQRFPKHVGTLSFAPKTSPPSR